MINCIFKLEEAVLMHHWSLSIAIVALADNYKIKEEGWISKNQIHISHLDHGGLYTHSLCRACVYSAIT